MDLVAEQLGIDSYGIRLLYKLGAYQEGSIEYKSISKRVDKLLGKTRPVAEEALADLIDCIVRCSSIVENLNSRLRTAFNDMRGTNDAFLELLQCYINTKKYRRSNIKERKGKSPLELYNGDSRSFTDILFPEKIAV